MNVSLSPELEQFVQSKVASGYYVSTSEVIRESLRLMRSYEDQKSRQAKAVDLMIEEGLRELAEGKGVNADEAFARIEAIINKRARNN